MSDCWDDEVVRGATWSRTLTWKDETSTPVNLTGASIRYVVRRGNTPLHELTTANGGVTILTPAADGRFKTGLSAAQTLALPAGMLTHDVWVTLGAAVTHLVCGRVAVSDC